MKRPRLTAKIAIKLYSPPSPPPLGGHSLARPQSIRAMPTMLENGFSQFMQFRQQQAAAAAQADIFARLQGRPMPRLPLPLPLPFLHAHAAAAAAAASSPFADNLRARFSGFAAAAAASAAAHAANSSGNHCGGGSASLPPPSPSLNLHPHPPASLRPPSISQSEAIVNNSMPPSLMVGPTSPPLSCRNPYSDEPMSPNGNTFKYNNSQS